MSTFVEKDSRYIWHPFTQHKTESEPPIITNAKGSCLYDETGKEILDLISSWWTCTHGHSHADLNHTLFQQAETLEHVMFAGFSHPKAIELAQSLAENLPDDLNRVFFSDNGSTAVEVATKISYQYWKNKEEPQRKNFIAFEGAYHGDTIGAMSLGQSSDFFQVFKDLLFTVDKIPFPETWQEDESVDLKEKKSLDSLKYLLETKGDTIAALIVEPLMQGAAGIRLCRPEFMKKVVTLVQKQGILVIFDEVAVGFGRSGSLFACQKIGVTPDLICLSKGLTAGYMPLSVTISRDYIYDAFLGDTPETAFLHGHSFTANPLACAVALESLNIFEREKTLNKIAKIEKSHQQFLAHFKQHKLITKPRCMGSILAFNLPDIDGYKSIQSETLRKYYLKQGLNIRPIGSTIYMMPPYCITQAQLDQGYEGIMNGLSQL